MKKRKDNLDLMCKEIVASNPNKIVPWYLMASYLYYQCDESLLSDSYYDYLCKDMISNWNKIEHYNKNLIDKGQLEAGTGAFIKLDQYPSRCKSAAKQLLRDELGYALIQEKKLESNLEAFFED